jgi:hypothetical protein
VLVHRGVRIAVVLLLAGSLGGCAQLNNAVGSAGHLERSIVTQALNGSARAPGMLWERRDTRLSQRACLSGVWREYGGCIDRTLGK